MLLPDFSEWQPSGEPDWIPTPDFAGVKRRNGGAAIIRVGIEPAVTDLTGQVADLAHYVRQHLPDPQGVEHVSTR